MPLDLDRLLREEQPSEEVPSALSALAIEKQSIEADKQSIEAERQREVLDGLVQDREQRKTYSKCLFWLICVWMGLILLIVFLHGFEGIPFRLTQTELVTLIGSTTINVIGLFAIVARYLFPKR